MDEEKARQKLLEKIEDLKSKIESNEEFPEGKQNISFLIEVDDRIDEVLNCWYY